MSTPTFLRAPAVAPGEVPEPPFARFLFSDTRASWIGLIVRRYIGYEWISAGGARS